MIRLIDSTTIDLNLNQFEWAKFRSTKVGIKLHTVYDPEAEIPVFFEMTTAKVNDAKSLNSLPMLPKATYVVDRAYNNYRWYYSLDQQGSTFVGRMKINARYRVAKTLTPVGEGILGDEVIELTTERAKKDCPIPLRRVTFIRATDDKKLVFISNDFKRTAEEIAALYKQRWEIELFFKWIKQNLKIKRFMGRNENSVLIQVLVAMIAYLLLRLTQITSYCSLSLQQISRLIAINLTARTSLLALLHPSPDPGTTRKVDSKQLLLRLADA
jgi:transposase